MAIVTATAGIDVFDGLSGTTSGNDTLNAANGTANAGDVWNGGDGTDTLVLTSSGAKIDLSVVEISGFESLVSGRRGDIITLSLDDYDQFNSINTGKGKDTLNIAVSGSHNVASSTLATLTGVETLNLVGSSGADSATFSGAQLDKFASIAMGAGQDLIGITSTSLKLNASSDLALTGVETVSAAGALSGVVISLANQTEAMTIIGSNGADTITGTASHDTINAGGGNDTIRIATGQFVAGESLNGGAGIDTLLLGALGASVDFSAGTLSNVEKLTGSSRLDTVTLTAAQWAELDSIDLGSSSDTLTTELSGTVSFSDHPTVAGVEIANLTGTAGDESISLDGATLDALVSAGGKLDLGNGADLISLLSTSAVLNALGASDAAISGLETITAQDALSGIVLSLINQTEAFDFTGSANADDFTGGLGADVIAGGLGDDALKGGGGNDQITGGSGADQIDGGAGFDTVNYSNSALGVTVSLKTGTGARGRRAMC